VAEAEVEEREGGDAARGKALGDKTAAVAAAMDKDVIGLAQDQAVPQGDEPAKGNAGMGIEVVYCMYSGKAAFMTAPDKNRVPEVGGGEVEGGLLVCWFVGLLVGWVVCLLVCFLG